MLMLLFTTQKNDVKGEVVGQGPSGDPLLCPQDALARRIIHLRKHNVDKTRPIASFMTPKGSCKNVTPTMITKVLKGAVSLKVDRLVKKREFKNSLSLSTKRCKNKQLVE